MSKLVVNLDRFWFDLGFGIPFGFRPPGPDRACCSWRYLKQPQATHGSEDAPVTTQDNPKMPLRPATRLPKRPSSKPRGGASLLVSLPPPTGPVRTVARFPSSHVFRPYTSLTLSFVRFAFLRSLSLSFLLHLGSLWGSIWGPFWAPISTQLGPKTAFGTIVFERHNDNYSRNLANNAEKSITSSLRGDPKRPKIGRTRPQADLKE